MKNLGLIFIIMVSLFLLLLFTNNLPWIPFGNGATEANVSDSIDKIDIEIAGANTEIIPDNRSNIKAKLDGKGKVVVKQHDDEISIKMKRKWFEWFSFFNTSKLTIYIPKDYNKKIEIENGSGNLTFNGEKIKLHTLSIDVGSGNVKLSNIHTNSFSHDGSSGNLHIDTMKTEEGSFDISSGNVDLKHYTGKLKADLSSGSFKVQMDNLTDSVDIDVSSGNVKLDLPDDANFRLDGNVSSGNISSDLPLQDMVKERKNLKGKYGTGKYSIKLQVSSGNIDIY